MCAGLNTDEVGLKLMKESKYMASLQLPTQYQLPIGINAMSLKNRFCNIETDCCDRSHDWLL